jgi:splicing factor 3B subunit 3
LGTKLKQDSIPLSYTPRKFITHPTNQYFYMIEGDHRVMGQEAANKRIDELVGQSSGHFELLSNIVL